MKIIIDNQSDLMMDTCLTMVMNVMDNGRVSNNGKQYCYLTAFNSPDGDIHVVTDLNKKSDKFTIYRVKK